MSRYERWKSFDGVLIQAADIRHALRPLNKKVLLNNIMQVINGLKSFEPL